MTLRVQVGSAEFELPDGTQVRDLTGAPAARAGVRRPLPRGPVTIGAAPGPQDALDPLVQSMTAQDMELLGAVELDFPESSGGRRAVSAEPSKAITTVAENEDVLLLLETDGLYEWRVQPASKVPTETARRGVVVERASKTITFDLTMPGRTAGPAAPGTRGALSGFITGKIRAYVLKFVAGLVVGEAIKFLERKARKGFVVVDGDDPAHWRFVEDLKSIAPPADRPARVLLLVHGTFSSTTGGFGALTATDFGRAFLAAARRTYDVVVGYDHPTLSESPLDNANDLLARLERSFQRPPQIDALAHSRGALVLRSLIEYLLPHSALGARVRRAVFVGGTNGGTQLAEPDNWKHLVDLYTNLAAAASKAISLLGAPGAGLILREAVQTLGALVKYLATATISDRRAPGLSAMEPDGKFVTDLNQTQSGQPTAAESLFYVITSDFDIRLGGPGAPGISERLQRSLADGVADGLMKAAANDLVVDVPSMTRIDPAAGLFVKDRWDFGRNPFVYHTIYFLQADTIRVLGRWLQVGAGAAERGKLDPVVDLGVAADTSLIVVRPEDPFVEVLGKIRSEMNQFVVVFREDPGGPYWYAFRSQELLELSKKIQPKQKAKLDLRAALRVDSDMRLGEDSSSGTTTLTHPEVVGGAFGNRGPTSTRTIVLDGMAPRAVIEPPSPGPSILALTKALSTGGRRRADTVPRAPASMAISRRRGARRSGVRSANGSDEVVAELVRHRFMDAMAAPSGAARSVRAPGNGPSPTFNLAARMPQQVAVKKTAQVDVTISREAIESVAGKAEARGKAKVELGRDLIVQLFCVRNFEPVDDDRAVLDPRKKRRFDLQFRVRATDIGDGEVEVVILQGVEKLASLVLRPQIAANVPPNERDVVQVQHDADPAPISKDDGYPVLYIKEVSHGNDLSYDFWLLMAPTESYKGTSPPLKTDRAAYVAAMYKEIEDRWLRNKNDVDAFEQELRTFGAKLYEELVPPEIQVPLWEARNKLVAILAYSEEPFIPWEVVHLKEPSMPGRPSAPLGKQSHFLAQKGLVRWLSNNLRAPAEIRVRKGHSFFVIPDYPVDSWKLPEAQDEIPFLRDALHSKPYDAEINAIRKLLEEAGRVDHFHFAGHGEAEVQTAQRPAPAAKMMMRGAVSDGKYYPSYFDSDQVQHHAALSGPEENRPLVVLNACQVGRAKWELTSVGGFARAFLGKGAGAFVGTLWSVGDQPAHTFTETFYKTLLKGGTIAQAAIRARAAAFKAREGSWLAYVVYGSPHGRVTWDGVSRTKPPAPSRGRRRAGRRRREPV